METLGGLAGLLLTTLLWSTEIHTVAAQCQDGWSEGTKACYKVFDIGPAQKTWYESNSSCARAARGGMLATTDNQRDSDIVVDLIRQSATSDDYAWIGLNSGGKNFGHYVKDGWQWADGTKHDISDLDLWDGGEPRGCNGGAFACLCFQPRRCSPPLWYDYWSTAVYPIYVCQRPFKATTTPKPTTTTPKPTTTTPKPTTTPRTTPTPTTPTPTTPTTTSQPTRTRPTTTTSKFRRKTTDPTGTRPTRPTPTPAKSLTQTTTAKLSNTPSSTDNATTSALTRGSISVVTRPVSYNVYIWAVSAPVIACVILAVMLAWRSGDKDKSSGSKVKTVSSEMPSPSESPIRQSVKTQEDATQSPSSSSSADTFSSETSQNTSSVIDMSEQSSSTS